MGIDSLYLTFSGKSLKEVILPKKRAEWDQLRYQDSADNFTANAIDFFFQELALMPTRNKIKESRASSKKSLDVQKCCASVAKHNVVMIYRLISTSSAAKVSIKEQWKSVAMVDQCQNFAKC